MSTTTRNYIHKEEITEKEFSELQKIFGFENIICAGDEGTSQEVLDEIAAAEDKFTTQALKGNCGYCDANLPMFAELTPVELAITGWQLFESNDGAQLLLLCPEHRDKLTLPNGDVIPPLWTGTN